MERKEIIGEDGLLHCSVCGDAVEREMDMPLFDDSGGTRKVKVHRYCRCMEKEREEVDKRLQFEEEQRIISDLRRLSLIDAKLRGVRFSTYEVTSENRRAFGIARKYVENFGEMFSKGQGILFWGDVGTGKSYTAAAIANELIDKTNSAIMTSFVKLIDELRGAEGKGSRYLERLNRAELLVVDDLGVERGTDFSLEKVYDIIDSRYRSGKPIILTTNLEISQMKNCEDIRYNRIYDRIFEMCYPVRMVGMSWRKREAATKFVETKNILEE